MSTLLKPLVARLRPIHWPNSKPLRNAAGVAPSVPRRTCVTGVITTVKTIEPLITFFTQGGCGEVDLAVVLAYAANKGRHERSLPPDDWEKTPKEE